MRMCLRVNGAILERCEHIGENDPANSGALNRALTVLLATSLSALHFGPLL